MKKFSCFWLLFLFVFLLPAQEPQATAPVQDNPLSQQPDKTENKEKSYFVQLKFGLGADFEGMPGNPVIDDARDAPLRNQLGISTGLDFAWIIFQQTKSKGAGDLLIGFGFDFQYWVPTTHMSPENHVKSSDYDDLIYMYSHYMRVPVTLNLSYEFKVNAAPFRRAGLLFSLGMNNNIFIYSYKSERKSEKEHYYKVSGTWKLGIVTVFENDWILNALIGGDFGTQNIMKTGEHILYDHHEFLMLKTGRRF